MNTVIREGELRPRVTPQVTMPMSSAEITGKVSSSLGADRQAMLPTWPLLGQGRGEWSRQPELFAEQGMSHFQVYFVGLS